MNQSNEERGYSGINVHWPVTSNEDFKQALQDTADGKSPNNISPVITYSLEDGVKMAWFGDLETEFMEKIADEISWPEVDIVFAPHHGRDSGKIPVSILEQMDPKIVVIGEAPSKDLNYYRVCLLFIHPLRTTVQYTRILLQDDLFLGSRRGAVRPSDRRAV